MVCRRQHAALCSIPACRRSRKLGTEDYGGTGAVAKGVASAPVKRAGPWRSTIKSRPLLKLITIRSIPSSKSEICTLPPISKPYRPQLLCSISFPIAASCQSSILHRLAAQKFCFASVAQLLNPIAWTNLIYVVIRPAGCRGRWR